MMSDEILSPNIQKQMMLQKRHEEWLRKLAKANAEARAQRANASGNERGEEKGSR
jgi:hypothetical protein